MHLHKQKAKIQIVTLSAFRETKDLLRSLSFDAEKKMVKNYVFAINANFIDAKK